MAEKMKFRAPKVMWEQQIDNIIDTYNVAYGLPGINGGTAIAHAVQKDSIQNAIDAVDTKNPNKWSVVFELHCSDKSPEIITIQDSGTYGLTGKSDLKSEILSKLDFDEYKEERWSRFESLGYANPDPRAIGARGQGKFIFIGTSEKKEMIYDTLRADKIYRVGHWITEGKGDKPLAEPLEGKEAKKYLKEEVPQIKPLKKVGTRVMIIKPVKELADAFIPLSNCDLIKYISETWWELLLDNDKEIFVSIKYPGWSEPEKKKVPAPKIYKEFLEHPTNFKYHKIKNMEISREKFKGMRVKDLVIVYSEEEIPLELRGISIQRSGMKVEAFDIREGNEYIDESYTKHIFGWVIFNDKAEEELKKYESPTHYSIKKIKGSLAQEALGSRGLLSARIREFAEKELGIIPREKREIALGRMQTEVTNFLNRLMRSLGYKIPARVGKDEKVEGTRGPTSPIRIEMPPLTYPGPTRRVEFEEEVSGIRAKIVNNFGGETEVKFEMSLKGTSRAQRLVEGKPKKVLTLVSQMKLPPKSESDWYGPYSILFSKKDYKPGKYTLKAEIVALSGKHKGEVYHKITRAIYAAIDPPAIGMFRGFQHSDFQGGDRKLKYKVEEEGKGLVIYVNTLHPAWKKAGKLLKIVQTSKEKDIDPQRDYYLDIGLDAAVTEDLKQKGSFLGEKDKEFKRIIKEDIEGIRDKILDYKVRLHQEQLFDALGG